MWRFASAYFLSGIIFVGFASEALRAATVTESGSDASDEASFFGVSPTPDLISASATYDVSNLYLSVRVAPGSFPAIDPATRRGSTFIGFYLDTDQNPATGSSYCTGGCDAGILGYEKRVGFSTSSTNAFLSDNLFASLGSFPATRSPNGFDVTIPLASLGDDGLLNFKVLDTVQLSLSGSTGILDVLPNRGLPAGTSTLAPVPEPANSVLLILGLLGIALSRRCFQLKR